MKELKETKPMNITSGGNYVIMHNITMLKKPVYVIKGKELITFLRKVYKHDPKKYKDDNSFLKFVHDDGWENRETVTIWKG